MWLLIQMLVDVLMFCFVRLVLLVCVNLGSVCLISSVVIQQVGGLGFLKVLVILFSICVSRLCWILMFNCVKFLLQNGCFLIFGLLNEYGIGMFVLKLCRQVSVLCVECCLVCISFQLCVMLCSMIGLLMVVSVDSGSVFGVRLLRMCMVMLLYMGQFLFVVMVVFCVCRWCCFLVIRCCMLCRDVSIRYVFFRYLVWLRLVSVELFSWVRWLWLIVCRLLMFI